MDSLSFEMEKEENFSRKGKKLAKNIGQKMPKKLPNIGEADESGTFNNVERKDSSPKEETAAKRQKQFAKCAICAQDSLYHYYGVQSCEGCKQFFRRSIVKQKMFICWKTRQCNVEKGDRCRGCRMDKCLLMGMDPSLVSVNKTNELDKFIERLEQNRLKLLTKHYAQLSKVKKPTPNPIVSVPTGPIQNSVIKPTRKNAETLKSQTITNEKCFPANNFLSHEFQIGSSGIESANFEMALRPAKSGTTKTFINSPSEFYIQVYSNIIPKIIFPPIQPFHYSNDQFADFELIQPLKFFGQCFKQIWESGNEIPVELMNREIFNYLKDQSNILFEPNRYSFKYAQFWDRAKFIEGIEEHGLLFKENMEVITKDRYLCMEMAKCLPFFGKMDQIDQAHILRQTLMPMIMFFNAFYSANINAETWTRSNGFTMKSIYEIKKFRDNQRIAILSKQILSETVDAFQQIQMSPDEFIILVALLIATTTSTEISPSSREFLYAESVRYSKALFRLVQSKYGPNHPQKYAELMNMLNMGHKYNYLYQTMVIYMDLITREPNKRKVFPKSMSVLMF